MDPILQPDSVGRRDAIGTHGLRGVFPTLPLGVKRLSLRSQVARFRDCRVGRSSSPRSKCLRGPATSSSRTASCSTACSARSRVPRADCRRRRAADLFRTADFVPAAAGRIPRGLQRARAGHARHAARDDRAGPRDAGAAWVSDLVVTCDAPVALGPSVRLDPNPSLEVAAGDPATAYFEGTASRPTTGTSRFEYSLPRALGDARPPGLAGGCCSRLRPELDGTWRGEHSGGVRRRYVSVPLQSLPPGSWRLEVRVRDQLTGEEAARETQFTRLPSPAGTSH